MGKCEHSEELGQFLLDIPKNPCVRTSPPAGALQLPCEWLERRTPKRQGLLLTQSSAEIKSYLRKWTTDRNKAYANE
jgi:hypothetical protein